MIESMLEMAFLVPSVCEGELPQPRKRSPSQYAPHSADLPR